jgi:hypothetical protein
MTPHFIDLFYHIYLAFFSKWVYMVGVARKAEAACPAREENRNLPQRALFALRDKLSFSQRASRCS